MLQRLFQNIQPQLTRMEEILLQEATCGIERADTIIRHMIQNGGKRIRPALFLWTARLAGALGGTCRPTEDLCRIAAAFELTHTASLLHDDVIDGAPLRRGAPTANATWGNHASVLVGDFLWCRASLLAVAQKDERLLKALTEAVQRTTQGELLELAHQRNLEISEEMYLKMIAGKTAALFAAASRAGAIVGTLDAAWEKSFSDFGHHLGMAFQLADDALDYAAQEQMLGKAVTQDLCSHTVTYPLLLLLKQASEKDLAIVHEAFRQEAISSSLQHAILALIERYEVIPQTLELARLHSAKAQAVLDDLPDHPEREVLMQLANYVALRSS